MLETMRKPTIAAVNGYALGGGCEMALACDVRLASENAHFGQPEINLGIIPGWGATQRLARATNIGYAKELILTGRMIDAAEALDRGLVQHVYPAAELMPRALEMAHLMASKSPVALYYAKEASNRLAPGRHRREPRPRGRSLLDHVLDRRRPRGPERVRREARPGLRRQVDPAPRPGRVWLGCSAVTGWRCRRGEHRSVREGGAERDVAQAARPGDEPARPVGRLRAQPVRPARARGGRADPRGRRRRRPRSWPSAWARPPRSARSRRRSRWAPTGPCS